MEKAEFYREIAIKANEEKRIENLEKAEFRIKNLESAILKEAKNGKLVLKYYIQDSVDYIVTERLRKKYNFHLKYSDRTTPEPECCLIYWTPNH